MRKALCGALAALLLSTAVPSSGGAAEIGVLAKGGQPEYLFIDKVPAAQAKTTAEMISTAFIVGRVVVFNHMPLITNAELGDKGFTGQFFKKKWLDEPAMQLVNLTPEMKPIYEKLVWAGTTAIDNNQDRFNVKGVKWKGFLPARWAREAGELLNSRTGILIKQPSIAYRALGNAPDPVEKAVLTKFVDPKHDGEPHGEFAMMGKQKVYRYFEPIRLEKPCLGCHGKPKGELDMLGYEKDGLDAGDVFGMMSVTIPVSD